MKEPDYEIDLTSDGRSISPGSFLMGVGAGFALGVIGTLLFAAYKEDNFTKIARKTRELGDSAQETAGQIKDKMSDFTEAAKTQIRKVSNKVGDGLEGIHDGDLARVHN